MRINKSQSSSTSNIINSHIFQHDGFTHAGFTNGISMFSAIINFDAEFYPLVAKICFSEYGYVFIRIPIHIVILPQILDKINKFAYNIITDYGIAITIQSKRNRRKNIPDLG